MFANKLGTHAVGDEPLKSCGQFFQRSMRVWPADEAPRRPANEGFSSRQRIEQVTFLFSPLVPIFYGGIKFGKGQEESRKYLSGLLQISQRSWRSGRSNSSSVYRN